MNDALTAFAKQSLKDGLARSPEVVARIKAANIEDVVDDMPDEKLDWAMKQVEATLVKTA